MRGSRARWVLRPEQWPERDRQAWHLAQQTSGRLSQAGPAAALTVSTRKMMVEAYGTYLAWLAKNGELDSVAGPADRLTFERLAAFLEARRRTCSDNTVFNNLRMLKMALACMVPDQNWAWVCHHPAGPLRHEAQAARKKPLVFDPGHLMNVLCREMDALMQAPAGRDEAARFRDCLLVATATLTGLRRRNLLDMRLEQNLIRIASSWRIDFREAETKTRRAIAMAWPKPLLRYLVYYLDVARPLIVGAATTPSRYVFVTHGGTQVAHPTIATIFARTSTRLYGMRLHPHSVRYAEATTMQSHDPNGLSVTAAALGHHGTRTTDQFYDQGTTSVAQQVWLDLVKRLKPGSDGGSE